jgi:lipoprotein-anchoring transpeptidase ErfK/SrfK
MQKLFGLFLLLCSCGSTSSKDVPSVRPSFIEIDDKAADDLGDEAAGDADGDGAAVELAKHPAAPSSTAGAAARALAATAAPVTSHDNASVSAAAGAPYPAQIRSVAFRKNTALHALPSADSALVGQVRKGTRAAAVQAVPASDCGGDDDQARWIQIAPRGWTCESAVEPTTEAPTAAAPASLTEEDVAAPAVRGVYGMVRRNRDAMAFASPEDAQAGENGRALVGSNTVRAAARVTIDGQRYWRTSKGELIDASSIAQISPSKFKGVAITDPSAMPAWIRAHHSPKEPVITRATASARGERTGELAARTVVTILETSADGRFVRIADEQWIARKDVRVTGVTAPPPGTGADEKWFDIDLDDQVLVAYQGERPVYATMVSTGKNGHGTPAMIARVAQKLEHAVMDSDKDHYSVADVPWTMYYDHDFALHTSYWHDGFGGPRSHGCINLAPRDARLLYRWSSPDVPPGWTVVYGDLEHPGSLVRVRSHRVPEPAFRGYARALHEQGASALEVASTR